MVFLQDAVNAHRINSGDHPALRDFGDFFWSSFEEPGETAALVVDIAARRIQVKFGLDPRRDVPVPCPMHSGPDHRLRPPGHSQVKT
jgi:exodeoxyribonuclease V alpha subunit